MTQPLERVQPVEERKAEPTRTYSKANFYVFTDAVERLGISAPDLCEEIGYSRSSHKHWEKTGEMPFVASLACEALLRRAANNEAARIILRGDNVAVLDGNFTAKEIHPGIWAVEPAA